MRARTVGAGRTMLGPRWYILIIILPFEYKSIMIFADVLPVILYPRLLTPDVMQTAKLF